MEKPLSQLIGPRSGVNHDPAIAGITADSRRVRPGWLFAALPGSAADGREYIGAALNAGAAAVIAPPDTPDLQDKTVPLIRSGDARRLYATAAAAFWGEQPATVVAVTGTNGKTSVATFCRQIFARLGRVSASMGTLGVQAERYAPPQSGARAPDSSPAARESGMSALPLSRAAGEVARRASAVTEGVRKVEQLTPPGLTTLDAADLARWAAELARGGVTHLALEASSHGLDQRRLDGLTLSAAGFTNLTQDHLDYHDDMEAYRAAKLRLFERLLPRGATAVLNADAAEFPAFAAASVIRGQGVVSVGETGQGLRLLGRAPQLSGQRLDIAHRGERFSVRLPLAGAFQASNALVAAGLCIAAGEEPSAVFAALERLSGAPGRLQRVGSGPDGGEAYVDYAHTPDGLATVLESLRPHVRRRLLVVFGAGGDRDRVKRPIMGRIAAELADLAIVTDDNPRSEDPAAIRREVLAGARGVGSRLLEVGDRRAAIRAGVEQLRDGDLLVVAGKGHEQGQTVGTTVHPFDDVAEVRAALQRVAAHA